jgi:hypothetical protein
MHPAAKIRHNRDKYFVIGCPFPKEGVPNPGSINYMYIACSIRTKTTKITEKFKHNRTYKYFRQLELSKFRLLFRSLLGNSDTELALLFQRNSQNLDGFVS